MFSDISTHCVSHALFQTAEEKKGMYGNIDMVADVSDLALEHIDSGVAAPASVSYRAHFCGQH